jgi:[acyl-carrier-protein] S-malonyltransferase
VRGEGRDAHRDERPLGRRHRADRGKELVGPRPVDDAEECLASLGQLEGPLAPVLRLCPSLDEPPTHEPVDEPARRGRRAVDDLGEIPDRHRPRVGEDVERGKLREPEPHLAELRREADDELAPEGPAHRHALGYLADVLDATARGEDGRRQVGFESAGDHPPRRRGREAAGGDARFGGHAERAYGRTGGPCNRAQDSPPKGRRRSTLRTMQTYAFVFPGQGSQSVGMGRALAERSPAAGAVFEEADSVLGQPISRLAWEGPADELDRTENAQPALLATSIAYLAAVRERWADLGVEVPPAAFAAGHSMGQYSALVAAEVISLADGLRLVRERGRQMQASGSGRDGAMAAIIGLDEARLPELVAAASAHGTFGVANRNAPGQVVVSGERAAIEAAADIARELGARKAIVLPVSVAAHSPLMAEAAAAMRDVLAIVAFADPTSPLLANADARPITDAEASRSELVEHLTAGVDWVAAVERMTAAGVATFMEVGPGRVLTGLIKRIAPDAEAIALDDPAAADRLFVPFLASPTPA